MPSFTFACYEFGAALEHNDPVLHGDKSAKLIKGIGQNLLICREADQQVLLPKNSSAPQMSSPMISLIYFVQRLSQFDQK